MGTDRQTDGQTQVTTITLRPKRPRVKKHAGITVRMTTEQRIKYLQFMSIQHHICKIIFNHVLDNDAQITKFGRIWCRKDGPFPWTNKFDTQLDRQTDFRFRNRSHTQHYSSSWHSSAELKIQCGVPQGSALIFIFYQWHTISLKIVYAYLVCWWHKFVLYR